MNFHLGLPIFRAMLVSASVFSIALFLGVGLALPGSVAHQFLKTTSTNFVATPTSQIFHSLVDSGTSVPLLETKVAL